MVNCFVFGIRSDLQLPLHKTSVINRGFEFVARSLFFVSKYACIQRWERPLSMFSIASYFFTHDPDRLRFNAHVLEEMAYPTARPRGNI